MKKNKSYSISENDLDKLLNKAFLNLDLEQPLNQKLVESLGNKALSNTRVFPAFNKIIFNKLILFVSACVFTDSLLSYLKNHEVSKITFPIISSQTPNVQQSGPQAEPFAPKTDLLKTYPANKYPISRLGKKAVPVETQEKIALSGIVQNAKTGERLKGAAIYKLNSATSVASTDQGYFSLQLPKGENVIGVSLIGYQTYTFSLYSNEDVNKDIDLKEVWKALDEVTVRPEEYVFPVLTEKEKKANEKEKRNMAKLAARTKPVKLKHEEKYPFIPPPIDQAFQGFNMSSNEITNLEYRTFLFDLLIAGKKEEFLIAKPEQNLWNHAGSQETFDTLANVYFSEKKYNFFPVVNISLAGAQMYCNWLTDQANVIRRKEAKPEITVRLPYEREWIYSASGGHPGATYPWPSDSVQNRVNWFLANCCIQKLSDKLKYPLGRFRKSNGDSRYAGDTVAYTSAGMTLGNKRIATIEVFAYNPNDFRLFCMSGNVSEIVFKDASESAKTKGGNWNSDFEHLKLNSEDEFTMVKPSPMIGFRVVLVNKK